MNISEKRRIKLLYNTREKYPNFRVDLTVLFSGKLSHELGLLDWHMQSDTPSETKTIVISENERVHLGYATESGSIFKKIKNYMFGIIHDLRLLNIARKDSYDIIQVRDKFFASLIGILAAKIYRSKFVFWMSFPYPETDIYRAEEYRNDLGRLYSLFLAMRGYATKFLLYKIILPMSDHAFVQSNKMLEDVQSQGIPSGKMSVVPMGIEVSDYEDVVIEDKRRLNEVKTRLHGQNVIIYVGTMVRMRGIEFIIEAFKLCKKKIADCKLLLVGDAPEEDMLYLENKARELGLKDDVIFTGFVTREEVIEFIKMSDVCTSLFKPHPILDSTSPTKLIEYMACERPVVVNEHPDQSLVINESKGGVISSYEVNDFANGIVKILSDKYEAKKMGSNGKQYVFEKRNYDSISDAVMKKYINLLENGQN